MGPKDGEFFSRYTPRGRFAALAGKEFHDREEQHSSAGLGALHLDGSAALQPSSAAYILGSSRERRLATDGSPTAKRSLVVPAR
jgi:hypothetical protein